MATSKGNLCIFLDNKVYNVDINEMIFSFKEHKLSLMSCIDPLFQSILDEIISRIMSERKNKYTKIDRNANTCN